MGKLTKRISPIKWLSAPSLNFQQGQSGQIKVRDYVHDPQRLLPTITLNGTLPTGCSFNGEDVSYDGVGVAASSSVTFTAATGTWSQTSSSTTCAIQASQQNNPPVWATIPPQTVATGYVGPVLDLANYCTDPDGDPITYGASGLPTGLTLQGSVIQADGLQVASVSSITATANDTPTAGDAEADWLHRAGLTLDGNGDLMVDVNNTAAAGVLWAHDFRYEQEVEAFRIAETWTDPVTQQYYPQGVARNPDPYLGDGQISTLRRELNAIPGANSASAFTWAGGFANSPYFTPDTQFLNQGVILTAEYRNGQHVKSYGSGQMHELRGKDVLSAGGWYRVLAPLPRGHNGLPYADRAANGAVEVGEHPSVDFDTKAVNTNWCNYGAGRASTYAIPDRYKIVHPKYLTRADYAIGGVLPGDDPKRIIGHEIWIQFRVRLNADRAQPREAPPNYLRSAVTPEGQIVSGNYFSDIGKYSKVYEWPPAGKLAFIFHVSAGDQEIVPFSSRPPPYMANSNTEQQIIDGETTWAFGMYTTQAGRQLTAPPPPNVYPGAKFQPGGPYDLTAITQRDLSRSDAWHMPLGEWVTIMYHLRPGTQNNIGYPLAPDYTGGTLLYEDSLCEVFVAEWGQTSWTTIFSGNYAMNADSQIDGRYAGDPEFYKALPGFSSIAFNCYFNQTPSFRFISQEYTQIICSTQEIPCPQVY